MTHRLIPILFIGSILMASCSSTTMIQSYPKGAKVYLNGELAGQTPYAHRDTKIVGTCTTVKLEKPGYEPFNTSICRDEEPDVGAIIGGIFFFVPFLWTMKYKPTHTYELVPSANNQNELYVAPENQISVTASKAERLRELKELFDDGILTQEEYEKEKKKILDEK